jgi:hypothetical protein
MIAVASYTSEAELKAAYRARRQRLGMEGPRLLARRETAPVRVQGQEPRDTESFPTYQRFMAKKIPTWQLEDTHFNHHETAWKFWKIETLAANGSPLKAYIRRRALEMGFTYAEVIGPSRKVKLVEARHQIIWEIKRVVKPDVSYPELGRLFGGRDHTTTLHAVRRVDAERAKAP